PILIVFLCVTSLVSFFLNNRLNKWVAVNTEERVGYEQRMQYVISATNDMQAAKDIRLYNMSVWLNGIYEKNLKGVINWYKKYTSKLFRVSAADSGFSLLREGVTYAFLLYMVLKKNLSVADFVLYFGVVAGFSALLDSLLSQLTHISGLNLSVNRIRSYLEYPEEYLREGGAPLPDKESPSEIRLENVSFRYKEDGEDILKNINITLKPGEHLAVVGLNGAGKTTMVKLMCGLTEPSSGRVLYNGRDIREYNRDEYYRLFGAVFQDYSLMPVTIEEIVAEDVAGKIDREKVEKCLKTAGLWDKVASLKDGILSKYDKSFWDDGINLSGGEIQKLLLARALYRQSPVIILDEPTAALDPVSENRLYETYDEVMKGKSTIFISHRLASTRFCDRILLIENGRISEEGTHDELLNKKGRYYELFETQAKYYRENPERKEDADEA
ncbi:MAG: ABC transporter ATP-binding protein/permease, partial [Lachnospiraceae bacterium]|nr:ABC transporter ATP-binding protein/permease [Lachnospiraceae bacterium]